MLFPAQLSATSLLIMILVVLALDVIIIVLGIVGAVLFITFKAGKGIPQAIDKAVDYAVFTALRLVEDALESPPLDKVPILHLVLVGVKKAYDLFSAAQGLILVVVNIAVTLVAIALALLLVAALLALNMAAVGTAIHYIA